MEAFGPQASMHSGALLVLCGGGPREEAAEGDYLDPRKSMAVAE
jgi:hypothetical protein